MPTPPIVEPEQDDAPNEVNETTLRSPQTPATLSDLAALGGGADKVIEARVRTIETLRRASIRATSPEDWVLYKAPDDLGGQIVGYLQDCGTDRVRDLWGIEIYDVSKPQKLTAEDGETFHYLITGSGHCKLTRQVVVDMEGGRNSSDDFCRDKTGLEKELAVRKAARANLDGGITRELAGMKSVPIDELKAAWVGTSKVVERCRLGRGFGSRDVRMGARDEKVPAIEPPVCPHCNTKGVYRAAKGNRGAFYGCPNYGKHPQQKWIVDVAEWTAKHSQPAAAAPPAAAGVPAGGSPVAGAAVNGKPAAPLTANDIAFHREPGQEG